MSSTVKQSGVRRISEQHMWFQLAKLSTPRRVIHNKSG
ncbi:Hypothetical protein RY69_1900 [Bifidobacterium breve]|nr:Hypothetical protein RY69_1900 [Bifidobacterium breve]